MMMMKLMMLLSLLMMMMRMRTTTQPEFIFSGQTQRLHVCESPQCGVSVDGAVGVNADDLFNVLVHSSGRSTNTSIFSVLVCLRPCVIISTINRVGKRRFAVCNDGQLSRHSQM
jgi:hypothetical protein